MPKITTFLTFNSQAEEAATQYVAIFPNSRITNVTRYGTGGAASVLLVAFELDGQAYSALNGGPSFRFAEGISLFVSCETQAEVDTLWEQLSAGGEPGPCGWLKDRFGVSWQVVPTALNRLLQDPDRQKTARVLQAMMKMSKIDIAGLEQAAAG